MKKLFLLALLLLASLQLQAGTVYKSVGPDGRPIYSDQEPPKKVRVQVLSFEDAPATPLPPELQRYRDELQKRSSQVVKVDDSKQAVLFSAQWCGYCRKAKAYLASKGIAYKEYDIDTEDGMRAMVSVGGGKGVPVLLWKGQRQGGFSPEGYDAFFARAR
ncbi:MAG: glutaredoxin-like protein YruB [Proteobacteria bacterium]|nr:glutaredoxin-like protein YruB [Pseudomonadota bacterium]